MVLVNGQHQVQTYIIILVMLESEQPDQMRVHGLMLVELVHLLIILFLNGLRLSGRDISTYQNVHNSPLTFHTNWGAESNDYI